MLSRTLTRALVQCKGHLPPTFLLPWTASLSTAATSSLPDTLSSTRFVEQNSSTPLNKPGIARQTKPQNNDASARKSNQPLASESVKQFLPALQAQGQHYITTHIQGFPYLVTQGDTLRLPFLLHGVHPGDILRLDCASILGSRDYTLKASAAGPTFQNQGESAATQSGAAVSSADETSSAAPHYIPHIAKGKNSFLDPRLFVCRATVMGVESEPLRVKEKTKRRQRKVKKVKSKHRYTILKIKELRVRTMEEIESGDDQ